MGGGSCGWRSCDTRSKRETRGASDTGADAEGARARNPSAEGLGCTARCVDTEWKSEGLSLGEGRSAGGLGAGCASVLGVLGVAGVNTGSGVNAGTPGRPGRPGTPGEEGVACAEGRVDRAGVEGVLAGAGTGSLAENRRGTSLA